MDAKNQLFEAVRTAKEQRQKQEEFVDEHRLEFLRIANGLEVIAEWIISIRVDGSSSFDINVAGDHNVFKGMWSAFRNLGYKCNDKPKDTKFAGWSSWWRHEDHDLGLWVTFSSTKCKRVKTGTKMVEQPIYETVCE